MRMIRLLQILIFCAFVQSQVSAEIYQEFRVARTYSDNMVLQMAPKKTQIWGFGSQQFAEITVTLSSSKLYTTVQPDFKWFVTIPPQPAGGPHRITITQTSVAGGPDEVIYLHNILFGDVWLCIGEANMKFPMNRILNASQEIDAALSLVDTIRIASVEKDFDRSERDETQVSWHLLNEREVYNDGLRIQNFPATCLMFGVELVHIIQSSNHPIGLVSLAVENTPIEAWGSAAVTGGCEFSNPRQPTGPFGFSSHHVLWNAMVKPLTKTSIRGIIWNQGESNVGYHNDMYKCKLENLIREYNFEFFDMKSNSFDARFPFGIVQLGAMTSGRNEEWSQIRWAQTLGDGYLPNYKYSLKMEVFMATSYDLTDSESPYGSVLTRDKKTVAVRLANAAAALIYKKKSKDFLHGPYPMGISKIDQSWFEINFDKNVTIKGTEGFVYRRLNTNGDEWLVVPAQDFAKSGGNLVKVQVPQDATHIGYAWTATVCKPNNCALYADNPDAPLPAQPRLFTIYR